MPKDSERDEYVPACQKVRDPCKICLQTVKPGEGLQCKGACEAWVHYECLNYTPGRIQDIEDGLIVVTCPCPDCKTTMPKEYIIDKPFTCNNVHCPANNPPSCEEPGCQANELTRTLPARCPPPGTLRTCCKTMCKEYTDSVTVYQADPSDKCMEGYTLRTNCDESDYIAGQTRPGGVQPTEVMQQLCNTVGDLAQQLNLLMDKINRIPGGGSGGGKGCTGACGKAGKSKCTQPCYCPDNLRR